MTIGSAIAEPMKVHQLLQRQKKEKQGGRAFAKSGSGGQNILTVILMNFLVVSVSVSSSPGHYR